VPNLLTLGLNPVLLDPNSAPGGWSTLVSRLPSTAAVYAWLRNITVSPNLAPEEFASTLAELLSVPHASSHTARLGPFHHIELHSAAPLRPKSRSYLERIAADPDKRRHISEALRCATPLQAPLYVGKAQSLRQRIEQHLHPLSDLAVRLWEVASLDIAQCSLAYTCVAADPEDDVFLRFVEETITNLCRPGFVLRPG
jgi:hypothetical protein